MKALDGSLIHQVLLDGSIFGGDYDGRLGPLTNWVNLNSHLFRGKTVLDLGSNAGHFPIEYVRAGAKKVIAVEGRHEFFDQWKQFSPLMPMDLSVVEWCTADVRNFIPPAGSVDIVSCLGLIYHVEGFLPKLKALSNEADIILVEVQTSQHTNKMRVEEPEDRTMSMDTQLVPHFNSGLWEQIFYRDYGANFRISRISHFAYGDVVEVDYKGSYMPEVSLTMRAFYLLARRGLDLDFLFSQDSGCKDITDQKIRVYNETQP